MTTYLDLVNGIVTVKDAVPTSIGASNAGDVVALNSDGQIDISMLTGFSQNVDGGFANSVYLVSQEIDGGGANG